MFAVFFRLDVRSIFFRLDVVSFDAERSFVAGRHCTALILLNVFQIYKLVFVFPRE